MRPYLVLDFETVAVAEADQFLEPIEAPANYRDPEKITRYLDERKKELLARAALDIDLARIVAIGLWGSFSPTPQVVLCRSEAEETDHLRWLVEDLPAFDDEVYLLVTFNGLQYDLPLLVRRCQLLGIHPPTLRLNKHQPGRVCDLMQVLSFNGLVKPHGLKFYAQRFGLEVDDAHRGADVAALVAADDWEAVREHCLSDVVLTHRLAIELGLVVPRFNLDGTERPVEVPSGPPF